MATKSPKSRSQQDCILCKGLGEAFSLLSASLWGLLAICGPLAYVHVALISASLFIFLSPSVSVLKSALFLSGKDLGATLSPRWSQPVILNLITHAKTSSRSSDLDMAFEWPLFSAQEHSSLGHFFWYFSMIADTSFSPLLGHQKHSFLVCFPVLYFNFKLSFYLSDYITICSCALSTCSIFP